MTFNVPHSHDILIMLPYISILTARVQLFEDNSHVGRFVNSLAADLEAWKPSPPPSLPNADQASAAATTPSSTARPSRESVGCESYTGTAVPHSNFSRATLATAGTPGEFHTGVIADGASTPSITPVALAKSAFEDESETKKQNNSMNGLPPGGWDEVTRSSEGWKVADMAERGALEKLWVCDGEGRRVLFADVSVYTRCGLKRAKCCCCCEVESEAAKAIQDTHFLKHKHFVQVLGFHAPK